MSTKYLETDRADEGTIDWYEIDGETYGMTSDRKVLDSDGVPLVNDSAARNSIEKFEASR